MADELKCKCGAGPFEAVKDLRIHILNSARKDGKGIHGWPSTKEFPNPPSPYIGPDPAAVEPFEGLPTLPTVPPREEEDLPSDLALELDEMRYMLRVMRSEFDTLKAKVERPASVWADVATPPPVDQEAVNIAQMDAMLGIDQPSPLDRKEEAIVAAVAERIESANIEAPMANSEIETVPQKGVPRGVFLILAFVAVVGVVVLVITQM